MWVAEQPHPLSFSGRGQSNPWPEIRRALPGAPGSHWDFVDLEKSPTDEIWTRIIVESYNLQYSWYDKCYEVTLI